MRRTQSSGGGVKIVGVVTVLIVLALAVSWPVKPFRLPWPLGEDADEVVKVHITVSFRPNRPDHQPVRIEIETEGVPPERKTAVSSPFIRVVSTRRQNEVHVRAQQGVNEFLKCEVVAYDLAGNQIERDVNDRYSAGSVHCYYNRHTFLDPDW